MFEYKIPEGANCTKDYIDELAKIAGELSPENYVSAVRTVTERVIKSIIDTPNPDPSSFEGNVYYVSNKGNDLNDGKSPKTAWKSLKKVNAVKLFPKDAVLFERGGLWRGLVTAQKGVTYSSYGEGFKPTIYGSLRNLADEKYWLETEFPNVYKLAHRATNVGTICFDNGKIIGDASETWGYKRMIGYGPFKGACDLTEDLHFFSDMETYELFLCSKEGNPGKRFKSIELCERANIFSPSDDCTIENFCVKYTGAHGVGAGTKKGLTVRNCIFCWIGGSILGTKNGHTTLYGNAVEIYGGAIDFTVENNYMYQIYDTGITNQCSMDFDAPMENVRFYGNVIDYIHWALEYYSWNFPNSEHRVRNEYMGYNICRYSGFGWGSHTRAKLACPIKSCGMSSDVENFVVERNIIQSSNGMIANKNTSAYAGEGDLKVEFKGNIYIHPHDAQLAQINAEKPSIGSTVEEAKENIKNVFGDENAVVVLYEEEIPYKLDMKEEFAY